MKSAIGRCLACGCCKDIYNEEFQKIVEFKDAGVAIYRHVPKTRNDKLIDTEAEEIFILRNIGNEDLKLEDFIVKLGKRNVSCPRCVQIIKHAKKLLRNIPKVKIREVTSVCDQCYMRQCSHCPYCERSVDKFMSFCTDETHLRNQQRQKVKAWLSKTQTLLKKTLLTVQDNIYEPRARSENRIRDTSPTFTTSDQTRISIARSIPITKHISKPSPFLKIANELTTDTDETKPFKKKKRTEEHTIETPLNVTSFLDFSEEIIPVKTKPMSKRKSILKSSHEGDGVPEKIIARYGKMKRSVSPSKSYSFETVLKNPSEAQVSVFKYTFPQETIVTKKLVSVSSTELIGRTQKMLQEIRAEAEKKKLEEERKRRREEEEKKRKTYLQKKLLADDPDKVRKRSVTKFIKESSISFSSAKTVSSQGLSVKTIKHEKSKSLIRKETEQKEPIPKQVVKEKVSTAVQPGVMEGLEKSENLLKTIKDSERKKKIEKQHEIAQQVKENLYEEKKKEKQEKLKELGEKKYKSEKQKPIPTEQEIKTTESKSPKSGGLEKNDKPQIEKPEPKAKEEKKHDIVAASDLKQQLAKQAKANFKEQPVTPKAIVAESDVETKKEKFSVKVEEPEPKPKEPEVKPKEPEPKPKEPVPTPKKTEPKPKEPVPKSKEPESKLKEPEPKPKEPVPMPKEPVPKSKEPESKPKEPVPMPKETEPKPKEPVPKSKESESKPKEPEPKPKEPIPKPKEPVPMPKETEPKPKEPVPKSKEPESKSKEPEPKPKEPEPKPKEPVLMPKETEPKPKESVPKSKEPESRPKEPEPKPKEPEPKPKEPVLMPKKTEPKPKESVLKSKEPESKPKEPEPKPTEPERKIQEEKRKAQEDKQFDIAEAKILKELLAKQREAELEAIKNRKENEMARDIAEKKYKVVTETKFKESLIKLEVKSPEYDVSLFSEDISEPITKPDEVKDVIIGNRICDPEVIPKKPEPEPKEPVPMPKEPVPKSIKPESKPKETEPKPKEPVPKSKALKSKSKEPEPKPKEPVPMRKEPVPKSKEPESKLKEPEPKPKEPVLMLKETEPKPKEPVPKSKEPESKPKEPEIKPKIPEPKPKEPVPMPKEPVPKSKEPESKPKELEPKPKEPVPMPKETEPKPKETVPKSKEQESKPKDPEPKTKEPVPTPKKTEPKPKEPVPKSKEPESKLKEPEPKPKEAVPTPKKTEPKPKEPVPKSKEPESKLKEPEPKPKEPVLMLKETEPKPKEPVLKSKEPELKLKEPEPKPKEPVPMPKETEPKPKETVPKSKEQESKPKDPEPKPKEPVPTPKKTEPKPKEPVPKSKEPESKLKEPEPKPTEAVPTPKKTEPKPKEPVPKSKEPESKLKEPEPKPKEPVLMLKETEPKPKEPVLKSKEPESKLKEPEPKPKEPVLMLKETEPKPKEPVLKSKEPESKPKEPEIKPIIPEPKPKEPVPMRKEPVPKSKESESKHKELEPKSKEPVPMPKEPVLKSKEPESKPKELEPKPKEPIPMPKETEPKPKETVPKSKEQESKPKEPEPKPKEPVPTPKKTEPKPKEPVPKSKEPESKSKEPEPKSTEPEQKTQEEKRKALEEKKFDIEAATILRELIAEHRRAELEAIKNRKENEMARDIAEKKYKIVTETKFKDLIELEKKSPEHDVSLFSGDISETITKPDKVTDIIIGNRLCDSKISDEERENRQAILTSKQYEKQKQMTWLKPSEQKLEPSQSAAKTADDKIKLLPDQEAAKGVIRYALSDSKFIDKGWTMLPTEKVVRKMNVYRMRPAKPEFDWFEHHKYKRLMTYDTGEILAQFDDNGRGRWYYRNGKLALDYYDAEELNAGQRFVVYSNGEPDERGRSRPRTVLATFDYLGNGIVFDHAGKIRLKYNQTEGVVLDRSIGPPSHWKWHTLNDPPILQQVMIDTQMPYKDPTILKIDDKSAPDQHKRPANEDMLAIEFENFLKEKSQKLTQSFKPFQIRMKAMKINENFSLRVLDQASVYLLFRDGTTNLKINIGMVLDNKEIVDTDTAEISEVSNTLDKLPACTDSIAELQKAVARAHAHERSRVRHEAHLKRTRLSNSVDELRAGCSRPLRPPLLTCSSSTKTSIDKTNPSRFKPSCCNLYYSTEL